MNAPQVSNARVWTSNVGDIVLELQWQDADHEGVHAKTETLLLSHDQSAALGRELIRASEPSDMRVIPEHS